MLYEVITIPIDSIFSPMKKVNFTVTNARVGQITDYDKLTLEVVTDGSVRPDDAVAYAAKILKEHRITSYNVCYTKLLRYPASRTSSIFLN